jgi:outer membrane protein
MNSKVVLYIGIAVISLAVLVSLEFAFLHFNKKKTGFVDINRLYSSYTQKKDLEKEFQQEKGKQKNLLDSLKFEINLVGNRFKAKKAPEDQVLYNKDVEYYNYINQEFERVNTGKSEKYKEQILAQLNEYVMEFGKNNGYSYIYGANGNGSLMYADEAEEITSKVVEYVNSKYNGK